MTTNLIHRQQSYLTKARRGLMVFVGCLMLLILFIFSGWYAVLYNPQYATLRSEPKTEKISFKVDDLDFSNKAQLHFSLLQPKQILLGANKVVAEIHTEDGILSIQFDEKDLKKSVNSTIPIYANQITYKKTDSFTEDTYGSCVQMQLSVPTGESIGKLTINSYEQGFKHFLLDGVIEIANANATSRLFCFGSNQNHNSVIQTPINYLNASFSIDSIVDFTWSSKGADTYEL